MNREYMMYVLAADSFQSDFLTNIQKRSRTAKGESHTGVSATKKPLKKTGIELKAQVEANTTTLIQHIWNSERCERKPERNPQELHRMLDEWYDIIQHDLQDSDPYADARPALEAEAERLARTTGLPFRINPRYRVWDVSYAGWNPPPVSLEIHMDIFYANLADLISDNIKDIAALPSALAWADRMMDFVIHPWADGCGRMSTALVMWLAGAVTSAHERTQFPQFQDREEHYRSIKTLDEHTHYFRRCLGSDFAA